MLWIIKHLTMKQKTQSTISGIENGCLSIGVERSKVLARAHKCHPAVLVFPGWELAAA